MLGRGVQLGILRAELLHGPGPLPAAHLRRLALGGRGRSAQQATLHPLSTDGPRLHNTLFLSICATIITCKLSNVWTRARGLGLFHLHLKRTRKQGQSFEIACGYSRTLRGTRPAPVCCAGTGKISTDGTQVRRLLVMLVDRIHKQNSGFHAPQQEQRVPSPDFLYLACGFSPLPEESENSGITTSSNTS